MKFSFFNKTKKYIKLKLSYPDYKEVFKKIKNNSEKRIIFNENYPILNSVDACSCHITLGKNVGVPSGNTLSLVFDYSGLGTLILENSASLFQIDDASINTGIINLKRKTTPIVKMDYTYW